MIVDRGRSGRVRLLVASALSLLAAALALPSARASTATAGSSERLRVLLVGNSYTRFNVMPSMLGKLAESAPLGAQLDVEVEAHGGYSLRRHWLAGRALALIRTQQYSHVVLQDHSLRPIDRPAEFHEYVARFTRASAAASARTVLYSTWPRHPSARLYREHVSMHSYAQMAERVRSEYRSAAEQLAAQVSPVGSAFERALSQHPELPLYRKDATHPTFAGSFLAACVLYGTLTGGDPTRTGYVPYELGAEQAALVKDIARQTLEALSPPPPSPAAPLHSPEPALATPDQLCVSP